MALSHYYSLQITAMSILINNTPIKTFNFPAGESHVTLSANEIKENIVIEALLDSGDRIMELLLTVDAIRRIQPATKINLTIPYFPYARQDRVCNPGEALSVKVMADLINNLKCDRINIVDPHSDVTPALLDNCHVVSQAEILQTSPLAKRIREENWALIAPDAGAEKKTHEVAKSLSSGDFIPDVFYAGKVRDTKTGRITATTFHGDVERRKVLIVDDICDGGRTFIELAKVLQDKGSKEIYLYVTHGIFSKGLEPLQPYFTHIYCYHTMLPIEQQESNYLTILSVAEDALNLPL